MIIRALRYGFDDPTCPHARKAVRVTCLGVDAIATRTPFLEDDEKPRTLEVYVTVSPTLTARLHPMHNFTETRTLVYGCPCWDGSEETYEQAHEVQVAYEVVSAEPRLAPLLETIGEDDEEEADEGPVAVPLMQSSGSVSMSGASLNVPTRRKYLILPGNYSGDSWASVAALVVDPDTRLIITAKKKLDAPGLTDHDKIAKQSHDFALSTPGVTGERVIVTVGGLGQQAEAGSVAAKADAAITADKQRGSDPLVGWTFATTSVLMAAAERHGVPWLCQKLRASFADEDEAHAALVRRIAGAGRCVLLNMRVGRRGNHPQHNMTKAIFTQLKRQVTARGFRLVRVGTFQDATWTPEANWMQELTEEDDGILIDLFALAGGRTNRTHVAYFWGLVSELDNVVGIIGGRSGSLDIAALMGVRTLCWDICQANDAGFHEYARQMLMFPIMSICRRSVPAHRNAKGHYFDQKQPSPGLGLEEADVDWWLRGFHVIPSQKLPGAALRKCLPQSKGVLAGRTRLLLCDLGYMIGVTDDEEEWDAPADDYEDQPDPDVPDDAEDGGSGLGLEHGLGSSVSSAAASKPPKETKSASKETKDPVVPKEKKRATHPDSSDEDEPMASSSAAPPARRGAMSSNCAVCETSTRSKRPCRAPHCKEMVFLCDACAKIVEPRCHAHR